MVAGDAILADIVEGFDHGCLGEGDGVFDVGGVGAAVFDGVGGCKCKQCKTMEG